MKFTSQNIIYNKTCKCTASTTMCSIHAKDHMLSGIQF